MSVCGRNFTGSPCPELEGPNAGDLNIADESGGVSLKTGSGVSVSGDAIINNRKKKLIPSYELEVKGTWTGKLCSFTFAHANVPLCCFLMRYSVEGAQQWRYPLLLRKCLLVVPFCPRPDSHYCSKQSYITWNL